MSASWDGGWLRGVAHRPSPNFSMRPPGAAVDLIVVHSISLPPGEYGGDAIERLFTSSLDCSAHPYYDALRGLRVSAHFVIRRAGEVVQFVSCDERAWHAGASAWRGRGDCNGFSIGVELEGLEDTPFSGEQYDALVNLFTRIASRYPIDGVAGHEHVAPGRKRDPGRAFEWKRLVQALNWPARYFPDIVTERI